MNEVANEKLMTIRNVADALEVSYSAVYRVVEKYFPDKLENGKTTFLTETEIAVISKELKGEYHTSQMTFSAGEKVKNSTTRLEVLANYKAATQAMIELLETEKAELQAENEKMKPKALAYDEFVSRGKFCNFRDAANYLHTKQGTFMSLLKSKYIYKNEADEYRCYSQYSNYFALRPFTVGDRTRQQLMLTLEGLNFFRNKIGGEQA